MYQFTTSKPDSESAVWKNEKSPSSLFKSVKRQITRNRTSYSCVTCRRRKVKCDKTRPICGGCQKANEDCVYSDDGPAADAEPAPASAPAQPENGPLWKKRKSSLGGANSAAAVTAKATGADRLTPPADLKAIEEQLLRLTQMVDTLRGANDKGKELHLKELLTPEQSTSESGSDGVPTRRSMGLDMFQPATVPTKEAADLSTPLSSLRLTSGELAEDPFWTHISDELDQLNHLMRRRDNTYVGALSPQNEQCDRPRDPTPPMEEVHGHTRDGLWAPTDFHKEAGVRTLDSLDVESGDTIVRLMAFSKSSLLQSAPLKCSTTTAFQHLIQTMPTRKQSNVLLRCWLSGVYPIVGVFMPAEISRKHEAFWDEIAAKEVSDGKPPDLEVLTALYSIWYAGSLSISKRGLRKWFPQMSRAQLSTQFHDSAVFCLLLGSFKDDISLYKLGALVLLQSIPIAEEDPLQTNLYLALIIRLALSMGLHREPTLFELAVSEEGMRRRLWWQIIQLDLFNVVASGYPSQISEKFCDVRVVCEDRDAFTSENGAATSSSDANLKSTSPQSAGSQGESPNSTTFRTLARLARGRSIMACALRSVVAIHLETNKLRNQDVNEMKRIMTEAEGHIHSIIKSIPSKGLPEMGFAPDMRRDLHRLPSDSDVLMDNPITDKDVAYYLTAPNDTDPLWPLANFHRQRQSACNKWARISLSMLIDKMHCVVYAPFLKNTKSKLWGVGRQCALHNCHSFLRKLISLATDPDLEPFRWAWPAMYGPLHAVLIVLVDVYERPSSVEASRSRELVDKVFTIAAPESGFVGGPDGFTVQRPLREGGALAWDMLRGLRSAAWQKAGLDPMLLWTEEDQIAVGRAVPLTEAQKIAQHLREDSISDSQPIQDGNLWTGGVPATEKGVRHLLDQARSELGSDDSSSTYDRGSCAQKWRHRFTLGRERDSPTIPTQGLVRREGQLKMPFPLNQHMEKCSGKAAEANAPPDAVLSMHNHVPRPEAEVRPCSSGAPAFAIPNGGTMGIQRGHEFSQVQQQPIVQPPSSAGNIGALSGASGYLPEQQANGAGTMNGYVDGYGHQVAGHQDSTFHGGQGAAYKMSHQGDTEMDLGFDWERWDAVFGQYPGFTDLMDDEEAWTDYLNT